MMDLKQAIDYLQPIADSAQLAGYSAALAVALDAMRAQEARQNPKTKADRIRAMSDREIALAMMDFFFDEHIKFCQNKPECVAAMDKGDCVPDDKCVECLIAWLRQPPEDGGAENGT